MRLLGPFDVRLQGQPLPPLRSQKGQWLLALLTLRAGREVPRAWLAETLWPDSLAEEALRSLRVSLTDLRKGLGSEASRLRSPTTRTLLLDLEGVDVDVLAFDADIRRGRRESLEQAVARYGGPFLEGCGELWALSEREAREQAYLKALETLATEAMADGDDAQAIAYLRRGVFIDLFHQSTHRALMRALAHTGDAAGALPVYHDLRRLLYERFQAEPQPETTALYQQIQAGARRRAKAKAPPLPPASAPSYPLPHPLTDLIGREREIAEIAARLPSARLVTLTGIGGIGKTRLALHIAREVAESYADGVCFVNLEALTQPDLVPQTIASALGLHAAVGRPWMTVLTDFLRSKQILCVLDNCEHLIAKCAETARTLLRDCPHLQILATSREKLGIVGEVAWRVPALASPPSQERFARYGDAREVASYPAVRLFVERATAVRTDFALTDRNAPAVARLCVRLDGIPLALELAAAQTAALSVEEIAAHLAQQGDLSSEDDRSAPGRQRSLRATIAWSYDLLPVSERALLRSLSVFAGGGTLEAVEAVCLSLLSEPEGERSPEPSGLLRLLSRLIGKSLVNVEEERGKTRYRLLDTVRRYARERLSAAGESASLQDRHLAYFLSLAERRESQLTGQEQESALEDLEREHDNFRAALAWSLEGGEREEGREGKRGKGREGREEGRGTGEWRKPEGRALGEEEPDSPCIPSTAWFGRSTARVLILRHSAGEGESEFFSSLFSSSLLSSSWASSPRARPSGVRH
jgi:predicted ATPase/DNA-binding SARP family transcriptional activator